jgi:hypothetical protein
MSDPKEISQRMAVQKAVLSILNKEGITLSGHQKAKAKLNEEMRSHIYDVIEKGFVNGKIALKPTPSNKAKLKDPSELRKYVIGLVVNWLKRDPVLNGQGESEE